MSNKETTAQSADWGLRPGEITTTLPEAFDAGLYFIGRIRTPWTEKSACPRGGDLAGPDCEITVFEPWTEALAGIEAASHLQVLYWMHLARRDAVRQMPRGAVEPQGTFSLRSPLRPNPIASSLVALVRRDGNRLIVRGLDCVDGTPLLDLKPEHCPNIPR